MIRSGQTSDDVEKLQQIVRAAKPARPSGLLPDLPWPLSEADEEPTNETTLTFEDGLLVE
jgi:hypothetical protein